MFNQHSTMMTSYYCLGPQPCFSASICHSGFLVPIFFSQYCFNAIKPLFVDFSNDIGVDLLLLLI